MLRFTEMQKKNTDKYILVEFCLYPSNELWISISHILSNGSAYFEYILHTSKKSRFNPVVSNLDPVCANNKNKRHVLLLPTLLTISFCCLFYL